MSRREKALMMPGVDRPRCLGRKWDKHFYYYSLSFACALRVLIAMHVCVGICMYESIKTL